MHNDTSFCAKSLESFALHTLGRGRLPAVAQACTCCRPRWRVLRLVTRSPHSTAGGGTAGGGRSGAFFLVCIAFSVLGCSSSPHALSARSAIAASSCLLQGPILACLSSARSTTLLAARACAFVSVCGGGSAQCRHGLKPNTPEKVSPREFLEFSSRSNSLDSIVLFFFYGLMVYRPGVPPSKPEKKT